MVMHVPLVLSYNPSGFRAFTDKTHLEASNTKPLSRLLMSAFYLQIERTTVCAVLGFRVL